MYQHHISDYSSDAGAHGSCLADPPLRLALFTRTFSQPAFNRCYFVRAEFHCTKILNLHKAPNSADMVYRSWSPPFQWSKTIFFIPHTDVDVLLDCGSLLEWNLTGMTGHGGGTPPTTWGQLLHLGSWLDEQTGGDTVGMSLWKLAAITGEDNIQKISAQYQQYQTLCSQHKMPHTNHCYYS